MARTVEDAARVFNVVSSYDPADPYTEAGRGQKADDYTAFLDDDGLVGTRIGVLRELVDSEYVEGRIRGSTRSSAVVPPEQRDPPRLPYAEKPGRQAYKDGVVAAMDAANVDTILYPTWTNPPAPLETASEDYRGDNSQIVAPGAGLPAGTVPMGYTQGTLPAGLQILARPYQGGVVFRLAYAYEHGTTHRHPPDGFPTLLPLSGSR